jgi:Tfp pilus assembly protein PilE
MGDKKKTGGITRLLNPFSSSSSNPSPLHWPRDKEEWKAFTVKAAPWLIVSILAILAAKSYKEHCCPSDDDESKADMSYTDLTHRKANKLKGKAEDSLENVKDSAEKTWFGLKKKTEAAGEKVSTDAQKARVAVKGKAQDVGNEAKEGGKGAKDYVTDKAKRAVDVSKEAGDKVEGAVTGVGFKALSGAGAAEEKTGETMKKAGKILENDGRVTRKYYGGEGVEEEVGGRKKWFGWF